MAIVRNRAMIPSFMSIATAMAVPVAAPATVISEDPGHHVGDVVVPASRTAPRPAPSVPPKTNTNSSRNTTGMPAMKKIIGIAAHPAEVATQHRGRIGHDVGGGSHRTDTFSLSEWPVSDRKTSSRSGVWTESPETSIASASSRVQQGPQ